MCVCVFFNLVEHLLLMGLAQLRAGSKEAHVSLLTYMKKGEEGGEKTFRVDPNFSSTVLPGGVRLIQW